MKLALKLFRQSAKHSKGRLALITFSIALGVAMIFSFSAYVAALANKQSADIYNAYYAASALYRSDISDDLDALDSSADQHGLHRTAIPENAVLASITSGNAVQMIGTSNVTTITVQPTAGNPPDFRGLDYPQAGEFYASAALHKVLLTHPDWSLRYGKKYLGQLPISFTNGPDEYLVVSGSNQLNQDLDARVVTTWEVPHDTASETAIMNGVLYLGLSIVLFPVALLISISAKLGNVQREQRYAALRLVGATNRQLFWIATTETLIASALGYFLGVGLYFALHPLLAEIQFGNGRFWQENITVSWWHYLATALLTLLLVYFANSWGLRRLAVSPLGVVRRQVLEKQPSAWSILPVIAGVAIFLWQWQATPENEADSRTIWLVFVAVILIMFGLTISGAWITAKVAQLCSKFPHKPTGYLGWKYVQAHASRISRSVAGVVLALYAGSFFLTAVSDTTLQIERNPTQSILADSTVIIAPVEDLIQPGINRSLTRQENSVLAAKYALLAKSVPGISAVNTIETLSWLPMLPCNSEYLAKNCDQIITDAINTGEVYTSGSTASAENSDRTIKTEIKSTPDSSNIAASSNNSYLAFNYDAPIELGSSVVIGTSREDIARQLHENSGLDTAITKEVRTFVILQVDSWDTLEKLRTAIAARNLDTPNLQIYPSAKYSETFWTNSNSPIHTLTTITYCGIIATIVIATISLLVSTYASILERRRTLLTLRLSGMTLGEIYRMILVESLAPLLVISIIATLLGMGTGWIFMHLVSTTLGAQISPIFIAVLICSLAASALAIRTVLPTVKQATALSANRQE